MHYNALHWTLGVGSRLPCYVFTNYHLSRYTQLYRRPEATQKHLSLQILAKTLFGLLGSSGRRLWRPYSLIYIIQLYTPELGELTWGSFPVCQFSSASSKSCPNLEVNSAYLWKCSKCQLAWLESYSLELRRVHNNSKEPTINPESIKGQAVKT